MVSPFYGQLETMHALTVILNSYVLVEFQIRYNEVHIKTIEMYMDIS